MQFFSLLGAIAPLSITIMLLVLNELSRRLGAVLKLGRLHWLYYVAAGFTSISTLVRLLSIGMTGADFDTSSDDNMMALLYTLSLLAGVVIGLGVTWRYWGWLVYASDGKTLSSSSRPRS